jgi:hypothetical protein
VIAHFMREEKISIFDVLRVSFYAKDRMTSSDRTFDRIGMKRIRLEKQV